MVLSWVLTRNKTVNLHCLNLNTIFSSICDSENIVNEDAEKYDIYFVANGIDFKMTSELGEIRLVIEKGSEIFRTS